MPINIDQKATVRVDAGHWLGELPHNRSYLSYNECNHTYTPEGQELLAKFGHMQEKPYYVRARHLLCTGSCHGFYKWDSTNVYLEDDDGNPTYDWTFVDLILDTILKHGCKPFVELGFMPQDLAGASRYDASGDTLHQQVYRTYGWACPPKDYQKWYDLILNPVRHCVERHGVAEFKTWYWEVWNERDIDYYWKGSIKEFSKLYDYTAAAVRAACPEARVAGPAVTTPAYNRRSGEFLEGFLDHCASGTDDCTGRKGTALDFTTFHVKGGGYAADPKHRKQTPPSTKPVLEGIKVGYEIISRYPGYRDLECILSEIGPDGWAGGAWDNVGLNFRNTEYYPSYVVSSLHKVTTPAQQNGWDLRLLTWAFMFVGERCFEGTRTFSTQGIDKAILNLFRMYAKMGSQEVLCKTTGTKDSLAYADICGRGEQPDISGFATLTGNKSLEVLICSHHDDWDMADEHDVDLEIANLPFDGKEFPLQHYRIDQSHSNARAEWVRQGKPMYPAPGQCQAIKARDGLQFPEPPRKLLLYDAKVKLSFKLPVHGISLLVLLADS